MVLALIDHDGHKPSDLSLELLTFGRRLAKEIGVPLQAALIGPDAGALAGGLAAHGVTAAYVVEDDRIDPYAPEAWAQSLVELMEKIQPHVVAATGSDRGVEVLAHVAARAGLPMAANCTEVHPGDPYVVTRQRWGGTLLEEARLTGPVKLLTVAPHAVSVEGAPAAGDVEVIPFHPTLAEKDFRVRVAEVVERPADRISLTEARVVVGGGRGVGGPEGFRPLEELAELLGGTVGCSRVVTSAGWRPHTDQIGQTGVRIAPDLYIACGISGATQHIVGCRGAKRILVINTDADAPIMAQADYAVIGDVKQVVPALNAEIRKAREEGL
ncbi:MAG: electron transfer flavoprotein subunit alpha/FixB family protein [Actinomycetota bacterium]